MVRTNKKKKTQIEIVLKVGYNFDFPFLIDLFYAMLKNVNRNCCLNVLPRRVYMDGYHSIDLLRIVRRFVFYGV